MIHLPAQICPALSRCSLVFLPGEGGRNNGIGQAVGSDLLWARGVVSLVKEFFLDINGCLLQNMLLRLLSILQS